MLLAYWFWKPLSFVLLADMSVFQVKSEFFDALSNAEKQAHDYRSKLEALEADFRKAGW